MKFPAVLALLSPALAFTGRMTYYTPGLGACGQNNSPSDFIVAIGAARWTASNPNNDPLCQKSIRISYGGKTVTAKVVDKCPGCGANDIDNGEPQAIWKEGWISPLKYGECPAFVSPLGAGTFMCYSDSKFLVLVVFQLAWKRGFGAEEAFRVGDEVNGIEDETKYSSEKKD
ncbi:hypothetical protein SUNI508_01173 [Seiridium unicorne]|uniref:Uncharacterized protein n=1 Tax=Seiridium unicorne TaxID=138068 RepID=A0ABR2UXS9_9PEZI